MKPHSGNVPFFALAILLFCAAPACADKIYVGEYSGTLDQFNLYGGAGSGFGTSGYGPFGMAFDGSGNLYVASSGENVIQEFSPGGVETTFATTGLDNPFGIAFDGQGNLYVANAGDGSIIKYNSSGVGTTFATAGLSWPFGLAFDSRGNLYVGNAGGAYSYAILKYSPDGTGSVFATNLDYGPQGLAFDSRGNLYVADGAGRILEYDSSGVGQVFASGLGQPENLAFDSSDNLYVADYGTGAIMKYGANGVGSLLANLHPASGDGPVGIVVQTVPKPAGGQEIVYVAAPLSNSNNAPNRLPWDSLGTQVGPDFPIIINGQTVLTFSTLEADGQPSALVVEPSSTTAVTAIQPNLQDNPPDPTAFPIPLATGTEIGPEAAGYYWLGDIPGGDVLAASRASDTVGGPSLTIGYFTGLESAYVGFQFLQGGETNYGWVQVGCPLAGQNVGWVYGWAYETSPNTPIKAGQISEPISFTANLTGGNEIPPNRSGNSGAGTFTLESFVDGFVLAYHLELDGLFQPTDAGIFGPAGREGRPPVLIADLGKGVLTNFPPAAYTPLVTTSDLPSATSFSPPETISSPLSLLIFDGQITLNSNQVMQLSHGQFYVNLNSARFRPGELRGGILSTAPVQFSATLSSLSGIPRNDNPQYGDAVFTLSGANLTGSVTLETNVSWTSMGIYDAPIPLAQTLVAPLTDFFGVARPPGGLPGQVLYPEQATLTDRQVGQLKTGQLFLQIRLSRNRNGEIGGRIAQTP